MHPVFNNLDIVSHIVSYTLGLVEKEAAPRYRKYNHWGVSAELCKIGHICHIIRAAVKQQLQDKLIIRISSSPKGAAFRGEHLYCATSIPINSLDTSLVRKVTLQFDHFTDSDVFVAKLLDMFETRDWSSLRSVCMCQRSRDKVWLPGVVDEEGLEPTEVTRRIMDLVPSTNGLRVEYKDWWTGTTEGFEAVIGQRAATLSELSLDQLHRFNISRLPLPSLTVLDVGSLNGDDTLSALPQLCTGVLRKLVLGDITRRGFISSFSGKVGDVVVFSELEHLSFSFNYDENENVDMDSPAHVGMFSFPKLRYLYIANDTTRLRYFFQNFFGSPLSRLHVQGRCSFLRNVDFSIFTQLEDFYMYLEYLQHGEAERIHRRVVTAGIPLRLVTLAINGSYELPYVAPTGCPLVQKYETAAVMNASQLYEALAHMPLAFRFTFRYRSTNFRSVKVKNIVIALGRAKLKPLNSKVQVLQVLDSMNTGNIDGSTISMELGELLLVIARLPMLQILEINADPEECKQLLRQVMQRFQSKGLGQKLSHFDTLQVIRAREYSSDMFD
ncbi:hypothetical protein FBU59_000309 [Linderina macrospora]|uniref:Uncharacterized protein n=1 Tax=Linderina macrospora TaxID=4868 RepID=A0ACC1JH72_9FUNG|nr:hypothetical protein FBU59_000309 [Linderina macrospora]